MIVCFPVISNVCEIYPKKEKVSDFPFSGTLMEYFPSVLVIVPALVPSAIIVTPGIGLPSISLTEPCMAFCCAHNGISIMRQIANNIIAEYLLWHVGFIISEYKSV